MATVISEFLKDKWRQSFRFFDANKDGLLTLEDHELMAYNMSKLSNASVEQAISAKENLVKWQHLLQPDPSVIVNEDRFVATMTELSQDVDKFKRYETATCLALFDVIDSNKNGVISVKEFEVFYRAFGRENMDYMREVFSKVDKDGDGYIDREEFVDDTVRFFTDPDPVSGQAYIYSMPKE